MAQGAAPALALALLALPLSAVGAVPPRPAPPVYATANYGLTFRSPPGTTYCPLPRNWIGSDHGTMLFLESPGDCGGGGYASSDRGFQHDAARIELFYVYAAEDDSPPLPRCPGRQIRFVGSLRPICIHREGDGVRATVEARYDIGRHSSPGRVVLSLVSRPERLRAHLAAFRRLAANLHTCTALWPAANGSPSHTVGVGPRCPQVGTF